MLDLKCKAANAGEDEHEIQDGELRVKLGCRFRCWASAFVLDTVFDGGQHVGVGKA